MEKKLFKDIERYKKCSLYVNVCLKRAIEINMKVGGKNVKNSGNNI